MKKTVSLLAVTALLLALPLTVGAQDKPCDPVVNLPWWEDFQAYPHNTTPPTVPFCWHFQGTNEPSIGQYEVHGSFVTCILDLYSTGETWAVLQNPFDTTLTINHMQVTFSAGKSSSSSAHNSDLIIGICKNPTNPVGNFTPLDTLLAIPYTRGDTMTRFTVDFSGYEDTGRYFCFLTKPIMSSGVNFLAIDSLVFDFNDHCMVPQQLRVTDVTDESAHFHWGQYGSGHAELNYKRITDTSWHTVPVVDRDYSGNGLFDPNTQYMARVRQDCSLAYNGYSDWSDTVYFTTDTVRCRMPQDLQVTNVANTSIDLHWTPGGTATQWEVHVFNSSFNRTFTATSNTYTVTGLSHGTNYRISVRSMCDAANTSLWTDTLMVQTSRCYPVSQVVANPTHTEALISWRPGDSDRDEWEVVYGRPGFTEGNEMGTFRATTPQQMITNLDSATTYVAKVRSLCSDDHHSEYTSVSFTTLGTQQGIAQADDARVAIYPNPASTSTTIRLQGVEGRVSLSIIGMDGRTLQSFVKECPADCETVLDVEGLSAGTYAVRIQGDQINITRKFNVQ